MKRCLTILTGFAFVAMLAGPQFAADNPFGDAADDGDKKADRGEKVKRDNPFGDAADAGEEGGGKREGRRRKGGKDGEGFAEEAKPFGADLDEIDSKVTLTDDQKEKLGKLKGSRGKMLEKWDATNQKKLDLCESRLAQLAGKDKKDRRVQSAYKQLTGMQKTLKASRARIEDGYAKRMFALLTPEQRSKWNAPILNAEMEKKFSLVLLEAAQQEKLGKLCEAQGKRLTVPLNPANEAQAKVFSLTEIQVFRTILNSQQKAEYRKQKALEAQKKKEAERKKTQGRNRGR